VNPKKTQEESAIDRLERIVADQAHQLAQLRDELRLANIKILGLENENARLDKKLKTAEEAQARKRSYLLTSSEESVR
jgi:uncharacterized coiled-coil protein SlyX